MTLSSGSGMSGDLFGGPFEIARAVPRGLIEHHHMLAIGDRLEEAIEELPHRLGVGGRQYQGEGVVGAGLHRRKDVGEREALIGKTRERSSHVHQLRQTRRFRPMCASS